MGNLPNYGPLKSGYDRFFGLNDGATDYFRHSLMRTSDAYAHLYEGAAKVDRPGYLTDVLADRAIDDIVTYAKQQRTSQLPSCLITA